LLGRASIAIAAASFLIHWFPFKRVLGTAARPLPARACPVDTELLRCLWAVEASARLLPWKTVCFQKGLALHWMLRARGFDTRLHYGVGQDLERGLTAHVWVSYRGHVIIGGEEASKHRCLAVYPPERTG
jgi:hypothetical protein